MRRSSVKEYTHTMKQCYTDASRTEKGALLGVRDYSSSNDSEFVVLICIARNRHHSSTMIAGGVTPMAFATSL